MAFIFFFFNKRLSFSLQAALETVITIYCPKPPPDMHCVILLVLLAKPLRSHKPAYEPSVEAWQFTPVETLLQWFYNDLSQPNVTTHYGKCRWTVLKGQHQEKSWFFFSLRHNSRITKTNTVILIKESFEEPGENWSTNQLLIGTRLHWDGEPAEIQTHARISLQNCCLESKIICAQFAAVTATDTDIFLRDVL